MRNEESLPGMVNRLLGEIPEEYGHKIIFTAAESAAMKTFVFMVRDQVEATDVSFKPALLSAFDKITNNKLRKLEEEKE